MAATISSVTKGRAEDVWGRRKVWIGTVTLDSSYAGSGGESVDFRPYIDGPIQAVFIQPRAVAATADAIFTYDAANRKVKVVVASTGAEAGAIDLSTVVLDVLVIGE